jgi:hypothetical protein
VSTSGNGSRARSVFEETVDIEAPVDSVFEVVADPRNDPRWCPRVVWCEQREGTGPGNGARYEAFHRPTLQRPHRRWIDVVSFEARKRMRSIQEDEVAVFDITYRLTSTSRGTRLTQRDEIEWKVPRLFQPIAKRIVRRHMGDQLGTLKALIEGDIVRRGPVHAVETADQPR